MKKSISILVPSAVLFLISFVSQAQIVVTNLNDSGAGSLRQAITDANGSAAKETIEFNIASAGPWVITLDAALPTITNPNGMVIDGSTQPGWSFGDASAMITIDAANIAPYGIFIQTINVEVYGMIMTNATFFGVSITGAGNDGSTIGAPGKGNVISGNSRHGINIFAVNNITVQGNRIGTSADGTTANGNVVSCGVYIENSDGTLIGGDRSLGEGNVISGNGDGSIFNSEGIDIWSCTNLNVFGNLIGTSADGNVDLGNHRSGITVRSGDNINIGGTGIGQGNVVSGNNNNGIWVQNGNNINVQNNVIGLNAAGNSAVPNDQDGIYVTGDGTGMVISGNTSSGNGDGGITVNTLATHIILITNNFVGTDISGGVGGGGLGNSATGIQVSNTNGIDVAQRVEVASNVVSGNGLYGMHYFNANNILIENNLVGTEADGITPYGNTIHGILPFAGPGSTLRNNTFAHNGGAGIYTGGSDFSSGIDIQPNSYFCNGTLGIDISLAPLVDPPVISVANTTTISGTSSQVDGSVIDVYEVDPTCADGQGANYAGSTTVTSGTWSLSGAFSASDYVATVKTVANGISEFSAPFVLPPTVQPFITTWQTDIFGNTANNQVYITTSGAGYNYDIAWEEVGNEAANNGTEPTGQTGDYTITFPSPGTYRVYISGSFPRIRFGVFDKNKLISVEQWGSQAWTSMGQAFDGCTNLNITASDAPDLSLVTDMSRMFIFCASMNADLNNWDVSNVIDMSDIFNQATIFNGDISSWDVSNVSTMEQMFWNAPAFNQNIGGWNVVSVTNMRNMFISATSFNQDIGSWDVSSVTDMYAMFGGASSFNQDITGWNVSGVNDMVSMFSGATSFNQAIGIWNVSGITDMAGMFANATAFNQDLSAWDVSNVTNMISMFYNASSFNGNLSTWDVSFVANMSGMFFQATSFNQPLNSWNVGNVTTMSQMFEGASSFNQPLNNWDLSTVGNLQMMFKNAPLFDQDISGWNVSNSFAMGEMFLNASSFDQNLGGWDVQLVSFMDNMFDNSGLSITNYDATLIGWESLPSLQSAVNLGAAGLNYCTAETARNNLISTYGWTIIDGGLNCVATEINGVLEQDYNALVALYNATDGPNWTNDTNWLTPADVSTWFGVVTSGNRVLQVNLNDNNLVGTLPPEIGDLDAAIYFRVRGNTISGTIPIETGNMASMIQLWLYDNQLTGTIPNSLANINTLRELRLDQNQLTGIIPPELGNLPNLWLLFVYSNQLTGSIPITAANFPALTALAVNNNMLSGPIPAAITDHVIIDYLLLGNNQFTGTIPAALANLTGLNYLQLHSNLLTGNIPPELGSLSNLIQLYLYDNQLTGNIPVELGNLGNLEQFLLNQNLLTGSIPVELGNLSSVLRLRLHTNQLAGAIPIELGNLSTMTELELYANQLTGNIPAELGNLANLIRLRLFNNQLSGSIPITLGNLTNLIDLRLEQNQLTGTIPSEFGNLTNLTDLRFDNNLLSGALPAELANLTLLTTLSISFNNFADLPDLSALVNMSNMQAHTNRFEFDDLEPNVGIPGIVYSPQALIPGPGDQTLFEGATLDITIPVGGSTNDYQWLLEDVNVSGQTSNNLVLTNVSDVDEGRYSLIINNPSVPNLTLASEMFRLTVDPAPQEEVTIFQGTDTSGNPISIGQTDVDIGSTIIGNDIDHDFTIQNNESIAVNITSINSSDQAIEIINAPTSIAPGTTEIFAIRLVADAVGQFTSNISINSDFAPFNFTVRGEVTADEPAAITVYNALSPNGDGKHDYLELQNIEFYATNRVVVMNRWGDIIYEASGYDNSSVRFEGLSNNGSELPPGTYYYQIDLGDGSGVQTGFFSLRK